MSALISSQGCMAKDLTFDELKDIAAAGLPIDQARELARANFTAEQILELAAIAPRGNGGLSKQDLAEVVSGAAKAAAEAGSENMRKAMHPQNARHPGISAFSNPEGDVAKPKPALKREVIFCGHREDAEQLTPAEIEAYNAIDRDYTARDGSWSTEIKRNGKTEQLRILVPMDFDRRGELPSLQLICRELVQGQEAVNPITLAARVAELEAKLAARA